MEPAERGTLIRRRPARANAAFGRRREIDGLDIAPTPILYGRDLSTFVFPSDSGEPAVAGCTHRH